MEKEIDSINDCVEALKNELIEYLSALETPNINESIYHHFQTETSNFDEINDKLVFLIFNYTNTIDLYNDLLPKGSQKIYIHGKINDSGNPIIFGYGDESDPYYGKIELLNSDVFLKNFKSFGYFRTDNYQLLHMFLYSGKFYRTFIMGHSCGISDRVLLKCIFENDKCERIKIFHHTLPDGSDDFTEKTMQISRHFKPELKDAMRYKILPFASSNSLGNCKIRFK